MGEAVIMAIYAEGAVVLTAGEIAAGAAIINNAALMVASYAISAQQQRSAARQARRDYNASLKDREIMLRTGIAPARVIYGRDKVSGPIVYHQTTGPKKQFLHLVVALAAHECDAIETIYLNEVALPEPDGDGLIATGDFSRLEYPPATPYSATTTAGGELTLPGPAHEVVSVTTGSGDTQAALSGWAHTAEAALITGLPASTAVVVDYTVTTVIKRVRVRKYLGAPGQGADADLVAASGGKWTAAHTGTGVAYVYLRLEYDNEIFGQVGLPNISAVVRGKKVYDPRTATTVWSENAALILADRLRDSAFGLGAEAAEVPAAEVVTAANACDEAVALDALGATQPRYTFNGSFTTDEAPLETVRAITSSMAGSVVWTEGRWLIRPGVYRVPTATWNEDTLGSQSLTLEPKASRTELFNAVRAIYRDPSQGWQEVQAPLVANPTYQTLDGGLQLVRELRVPTACDSLRAQRLAKITLERARQTFGVHLTTNLQGYDAAPTDTINLALRRYGWAAGKVFEVEERSWAGGLQVAYALRETAAGVYAWNYGEATTIDLAPDTSLPSPYAAPAKPTTLAVDSGIAHQLRLSDGTLVSRALATWPQATDAFVTAGGSVQVEWARPGATAYQPAEPLPGSATSIYLNSVPAGLPIIVRARFINAAGRASAYTYARHTVQRLDFQRTNLLTPGDWVPGTNGTQGPPGRQWNAMGESGENTVILAAGPDGQVQPLWLCTSTDEIGTNSDGGWNTYSFPVDPLRTYRITQWVKCGGVMDGAAYLGVGYSTVQPVDGGPPDPNPYFMAPSRASMVPGRWYLMVGYVFPSSYTGGAQNMGGLWDGATGKKLTNGTDFKWVSGVRETYQRSYLYYSSIGAQQWFTPPEVVVCDGSETSIAQLLSVATDARLQALDTLTFVASNNVQASGNTITKTGGASGWNASAYSVESYIGGAVASCIAADTTSVIFIALNTDPATNSGYDTLDWGVYCEYGAIHIYEGAQHRGQFGTYAAGDSLAVAYDGAAVRYIHNGTVLRTVAASITAPLHLDTSLYNPGDQIRGLKFGPLSNIGQALTAAADALATAEAAQATADGKVQSFWQAAAPAAGLSSEGDIWFDTDDGLRQYRYTSGAWVVAADARIGTAIAAAADAQATADGKVNTYVSESIPLAEAVGDLWIKPSEGHAIRRWSGSIWVALPIGTGALEPDAISSTYTLDVGAWGIGNPPNGGATSKEEDIATLSWSNTTPDAVRFRLAAGYSGSGLAYNISMPTDTWIKLMWASPSSTGEKLLQSIWADSAIQAVNSSANSSREVLLPPGETITFKLRGRIFHTAAAKIHGTDMFLEYTAFKR